MLFEEVSASSLVRIDTCASVARTLATTDPLLGAYFNSRRLLLALRLLQGALGAVSTIGLVLIAGAAWRRILKPLVLAAVGATFLGQAIAFFHQLVAGEKQFDD